MLILYLFLVWAVPLEIGMHFQTLFFSSAEGAEDIPKFTSLVRTFFLPVCLNLHGGHQTGFDIQVQRGAGLGE